MKKIVKTRHRFWSLFFKAIFNVYLKIKYKIKYDKIYLPNDQSYFILSNHQTGFDQFAISLMFNKPLYIVGSNIMYKNPLSYKLINYFISPIPLEKGTSDIKAIKNMVQISKENGNILLFPEGNRTYDGEQFYIGDNLVKLIRLLNKPLILLNIRGGFGVDPRFTDKKRIGDIEFREQRIIELDELSTLADEELLNIVKNELYVDDTQSGKLYKSNARAEYLERLFFVCPKCGKMETLYSKGNEIICSSCGMKAEYTEDLKIKSNDIEIDTLAKWYNYQKEFVKNMVIDDELICSEKHVRIFELFPNKHTNRRFYNGSVKLYKDRIVLDNETIDIKEVYACAPLIGNSLTLNVKHRSFYLKGDKTFNPVKYALLMHKLDTPMAKTDLYYKL